MVLTDEYMVFLPKTHWRSGPASDPRREKIKGKGA